METLHSAMTGMSGVHMASVFRGEADQFNSAVPFIISGLDRNEKCVYVLDRHSRDEVVESLMKFRDIQHFLEAKQLEFLPSAEAYLLDGRFDVDRTIGMWKTKEAEAKSEGYRGLRGAGEMTWSLADRPGVDRLREYEARINGMYPASAANFLCQYDESSFDSGTLLDVIRAHPKVVVRGELCSNPYFMSMDELLSSLRGVVPRTVLERTSMDILKRARFAAIHELELRDIRRANRRMEVIGGATLEDIQSQVSVLDFYTELALDSVQDSAAREHLERISRKCASIQKRLDFARAYQLLGQTELRWWDLRDALEKIGQKASSKGVEMELRIGNARVFADGLFDRALLEIVENMPDLRGHGDKVVVSSAELREALSISITHEGRGVPPAMKSRVFECGYRCGSSDGYGLFLASEILRSAGMAVAESGTMGKGSLIEILVPRGKYSLQSG